MNQRQQHPASNGRRHQPAKASRPGLAHRRVQSYHNAHSQAHAAASKGQKKAGREEVRQVEAEEDEVMAGLPQFCTTCERQIVNPSNSTLYCSRACQRRDTAKPHQLDIPLSPAFVNAPSYFDVPQPDILPQRSPTVLRPLSSHFSDLHLSDRDQEDSSADSDSDSYHRRSSQFESDADAATRYYGRSGNEYLDDVHHFSSHSLNNLHISSGRSRPHINRSSTSTLPSLSHTPSSSVGTANSTSYTSFSAAAANRPLPTRHDRHRSLRSADLVIPTFDAAHSVSAGGTGSVKSEASTLTSFHAAEAGPGDVVAYPKKGRKQSLGASATGSLRQLFQHEAMASTPRPR